VVTVVPCIVILPHAGGEDRNRKVFLWERCFGNQEKGDGEEEDVKIPKGLLWVLLLK